MANGQAIGVVSAAKGEVFARGADGKMRRLSVGDSIFEGDVIVTANGSTAEITPFDGPVLNIAEQQTVAVDGQVVAANTDATTGSVSPLGSSEAAKVIQTVATGSGLDVNAILEDEAAAAGLTGDGADGGNSFVDLMRIVETVPTAGYDFPTNPTGTAPTIQGLAVPETAQVTTVSSNNIVSGKPQDPNGENPPGENPPTIPNDVNSVVVSGSAVSILEGTSGEPHLVNFVMTLDHASDVPVTVVYSLNMVSDNGAAVYGEDWFDGGAGPHTVVIPAGETTWIVPLSIVPDAKLEANGVFEIVIDSAINAEVDPGARAATVTIFDDDVSISAGDANENTSMGEDGSGGLVFTVQGPAWANSVTVQVEGEEGTRTVELVNGQGSFSVDVYNPDVFVDPTSVTATIIQINYIDGGVVGIIAVSGEAATAIGKIPDVYDTTHYTLASSFEGDENGATVTYTVTLDTAAKVGETVTFYVNGVKQTIVVNAESDTGSTTVNFSEPDVFQDVDTIGAPTGLTMTNNSGYEVLSPVNDAVSYDVLDNDDTTTITLHASATSVAEGGNVSYYATVDHAPQTDLTINLSNGQILTILHDQTISNSSAPVTMTNVEVDTPVEVKIDSTSGGNYEVLDKTSTVTVTVIDFIPINAIGETVKVEEESIPGSRGNNETEFPNLSYTTTGNFADNVTWGTDGFGGIVSVTSVNGVSTVAGDFITVSDTYGTLSVNVISGAYTYTLNHNIIDATHTAGENIETAPSFTIVAKDSDGDLTPSFALSVNVVDDVPTLSVSDISVVRTAGDYIGNYAFSAGADQITFTNAFASNALVWTNKPSGYNFINVGGDKYAATYVDGATTKTYFEITINSGGTYDFHLVNPAPSSTYSSGPLFSGLTGGSGLSSYTFDSSKFGGAFSLVLTGYDNNNGADTITISSKELGVNGNSIQEQSSETVRLDVVQQAGYENSTVTHLAIGIAETGSLKTGDAFQIEVYYKDGSHTTVGETYDGSGTLDFQISANKVVNYVDFSTTSNNTNFKVTGISLEYTSVLNPADSDLIFQLTGSDADGDTATATFNVDVIAGTAGNDTLFTGSTADTVSGGAGIDTISTGAGNDILTGGAGNDILTGGTGADTFVFQLSDSPSGSNDLVKDFKVAEGDILQFKDVLSLDVAATGSDSTITAHFTSGVTQTVVIEGVTLTEVGHTVTADSSHIINITG